MSNRTIIEINHDFMSRTEAPNDLHETLIARVCAAFLLPKHFIEYAKEVETFLWQAQQMGMSSERAKQILDEEFSKVTSSSTLTSKDAVRTAKIRRLVEVMQRS